MKKKRYNFTLDEDLMVWLKDYCKDNRTTCSGFINQLLVRMKNGGPKLPSVSSKPDR